MNPSTILHSTKGRFFAVTFVKRSTNTLRHMNARLGVTTHLRGGPRSYDPAQHNLITVYDVNAKGYRSIPLDAVIEIRADHRTYDFLLREAA